MYTTEGQEMLLRLMDKIENLSQEQTRHHTFAEQKLLEIEKQAKLTNGRVTSNRKDIDVIKQDVNKAKTIYATLAAIVGLVWTGVTFFLK